LASRFAGEGSFASWVIVASVESAAAASLLNNFAFAAGWAFNSGALAVFF
jgi:hypothetical protein